jgi:hypothetical protein
VADMNAFSREVGILRGYPAFSDVVAVEFDALRTGK